MKLINYFLFFSILVAFTSCKKDDTKTGNEILALVVPIGFPEPKIPDDNQPTQNRIELGRKLFFDPILSRDSTISCSSCHHTDKKMTDGLQFSNGIDGQKTMRNAMTILNVAFQPSMFWDGGVPNLEQQVIAPIENHLEMDFNVNFVVNRLLAHPEYPTLFQNAYDLPPSPYTLVRAIANFERTQFTGKSRYDELQYENKITVLTDAEKRGMDTFFGESGECFHCHGGYNFTDYNFRNNGLYLVFADSGRAHITGNTEDVGKFKVPSLRNIEFTAPYMHDGSLATLDDVVEHYNSGGKQHPNKSGLIQPLNLTVQQKDDLVSFLKTLSDQ